MSFQQAVEMIDQEYNSIVCQTRVKNYVNNLRVSDFESKGDGTSVALAKVYKIILKLSRQVPTSHRGDAHRIEFLRKSVVGYDRSHEPLSWVATHNLSFQQVYGELEAALQLNKEAQVALLRDKASNSNREHDDEVIVTNFAGQGRYAKHNRSRVATTTKFNPLSFAGCFNCGGTDHLIKNCPKPLDVGRTAAMKIEYLNKKKATNAVHLVLASLCQQLYSPTDVGQDDAQIFSSLLALPPAPEIDSNNNGDESEEDDTHFVIDINFNKQTNAKFEGACIDSGAQCTLIGRKQADFYSSHTGAPIGPTKF